MSTNLLKRKNGKDYAPCETLQDGSKRYMELSDGQVLDNKTVGLNLTPCNHQAMKAWANAELFKPTKRPVKC